MKHYQEMLADLNQTLQKRLLDQIHIFNNLSGQLQELDPGTN